MATQRKPRKAAIPKPEPIVPNTELARSHLVHLLGPGHITHRLGVHHG